MRELYILIVRSEIKGEKMLSLLLRIYSLPLRVPSSSEQSAYHIRQPNSWAVRSNTQKQVAFRFLTILWMHAIYIFIPFGLASKERVQVYTLQNSLSYIPKNRIPVFSIKKTNTHTDAHMSRRFIRYKVSNQLCRSGKLWNFRFEIYIESLLTIKESVACLISKRG